MKSVLYIVTVVTQDPRSDLYAGEGLVEFRGIRKDPSGAVRNLTA